MIISTTRFELIASAASMVRSELDGDGELALLLNADIHAEWPPEHWDRPAMEWTMRALQSPDVVAGWGMWYWILRPPHIDHRTLVGSGGFKGPPNQSGEIEIGYSVVPEHRRRGLATEACRALMMWALRDSRVHTITAETYPHLEPSLGVMNNLGMSYLGKGSEPGVVRYGVNRGKITS